MPIVSIKMAKGRTTEQKRALAAAITDAMVTIAAVAPEWVTVLFEEYDRENWATAGRLHVDKSVSPRSVGGTP